MKTIKLVKKRMRMDVLGEIFEWDATGNWPFEGGRNVEWGRGHRCRCGNQRFVVCHRIVEIQPGEEGGEVKRIHEYSSVCGQCIRFRAGERIIGEVDYATMEAVVYDRPIPPAQAAAVSDMNRYIPINTESFDIDSFDLCKYLPSAVSVCGPVVEAEPAPPMPVRRGRKGKIRPTGPTLAGFEGEDVNDENKG